MEGSHYSYDFPKSACGQDTPNGLCGEYNGDINRLRTFVEITDGLIGSICADDYGPFFTAAAAAILERCKTYVPQ